MPRHHSLQYIPNSKQVPLRKKICVIGTRYDILRHVALRAGFEVVGENDIWNINWSDVPLSQEKILQMRKHSWGSTAAPLQKMNHFPGMYEICRKDRLCRNLNRLRGIFPDDYSFFPETWDLPTQQADLFSFARRRKNATFIVKPESGCQGRGIFLLRNLRKLSPFTKCVCQVYVRRPFLIDGYKFDQRIYALITCVDPLRVYIYQEGIARFATVKYEPPTDENLEVAFMHLTNYSLNKFSESYVRGGEGSKRKLSSVYKWMSKSGYDVPKLLKDIDDIVMKTVLCAAPTLKHNYKTCFPKRDRGCACFELLGFDILIDNKLKPFLLEVNHSPSFNLDMPVDREVKTELLTDMLNMVYFGEQFKVVPEQSLSRRSRLGRGVKLGYDESRPVLPKTRRKVARSPPSPPPPDPEMDGLPHPLASQFRHEIQNRGKFRLISTSEDPAEFEKIIDNNYCSHPATSPSSFYGILCRSRSLPTRMYRKE